MGSQQAPRELTKGDREKRWVAGSSVLAAIGLTTMKLVVGLYTNSLGILSEAAHSGLDLVAAGMTLWAVQISGRPADREHTYGHGKFENLSALFETLLLLLTCVWITYEAFSRLFFQEEVEVDPSLWAFLVVVISIVVDFSRSRALKRTAIKYGSQALEADALHFSTDIWSSAVVLLGLIGVGAGKALGLPWLVQADSLAALGVTVIVVWVSLQLGKKSIDDLLDRIPHDLQEKVAAAAAGVPGVEHVTQVRLRRSGPVLFADVTLIVARGVALERAHDIADRTEATVRSILPRADVVVHVEPAACDDQGVTATVRSVAARHGLAAHGIRIYDERGRRSVELHLEVDDGLHLGEAHRQATQFEQALRESLPELVRIVTHIEPAGDAAATLQVVPAEELQIRKVLAEFLETNRLAVTPHDVRVQIAGGELAVSFHCTLEASTAITDAHELTVRLEEYLRARVPGLGAVVIHVEPAKQSGGHRSHG
jgi:cation diffusion facilitator family transporter